MRPLPAYDSFGILDLHTDLPWLEEAIQNGFKAVKIKLGAGDLETDVAVVSEVRRTIGDGVRLMLDFNQSQTTASAVERILRLRIRSHVGRGAGRRGRPSRPPRRTRARSSCGEIRRARIVVSTRNGKCHCGRGLRSGDGRRHEDRRRHRMIVSHGGAEAAALPLSNHTFVEASAHLMSVSPTASWFEYLDIAGAVPRAAVACRWNGLGAWSRARAHLG